MPEVTFHAALLEHEVRSADPDAMGEEAGAYQERDNQS